MAGHRPTTRTPTAPSYWFLMQAGMIAGFFTAWPASTWLIRAGIKEAMRHPPIPRAAPGGWQ